MGSTKNRAAAVVSNEPVEVEIKIIPGPDFTAYFTATKEFEDKLFKGLAQGGNKKKYSRAVPFNVHTRAESKPAPAKAAATKSKTRLVQARGLACRSYRGDLFSVTLRCDEKEPARKSNQNYFNQLTKALQLYKKDDPPGKGKIQEYLGFCPDGYKDYSRLVRARPSKSDGAATDKSLFLNKIFGVSKLLYDTLFSADTTEVKPESGSLPSGLIAVTGATDSSKSLITRGLIFLLMQRAAEDAFKKKGSRKPHLLTFEDPIEEFYIKSPAGHKAPEVESLKKLLDVLYLDYTPREKAADANSLAEVIQDALRQTPAILFVGETREQKDWKDLLEFAGSGHLVITTSHASSVVEAMSRIFRDTNTKTPAQRSEIARRILGIINIRSITTETGDEDAGSHLASAAKSHVRALLPALWKRTPQSTNSIIADGLAALLPSIGKDPTGYYSRTYFAKKLTNRPLISNKIPKPERNIVGAKLVAKAKEWDMEGG